MRNLEIGDRVVFVASADPVMTVVRIKTGQVDTKDKGTGNVLCKWWDSKEKKFKEYYFDAKELKPYIPTPPAALGRRKI